MSAETEHLIGDDELEALIAHHRRQAIEHHGWHGMQTCQFGKLVACLLELRERRRIMNRWRLMSDQFDRPRAKQ